MNVNRIIIRFTLLFLLSLFFVSVSYAQLLDFKKEDIKNGVIEKNDSLYKVVGQEIIHVHGDKNYKYERVFVENTTQIEKLEKEIYDLLTQISEKEKIITALNEEIKRSESNKLSLQNKIDAINKEIDILKNKMEELKNELSNLEQNKTQAENRITGNFLLSPTQANSVLVLFVVLVLSSVIIGFKDYLRPNEKIVETVEEQKIEEQTTEEPEKLEQKEETKELW